MLSTRSRRRGRSYAEAAGLHVLSPLMGLFVPVLAVRALGAELWGGMVLVTLVAGLAATVVNWGQRDALLRDLGAAPAEMPRLWQRGLATRLVLVWPAAAAVLVVILAQALPDLPAGALALACLWVAAQAVARSADAVVLRRKLFGARMGIDLGVTALQLTGLAVLARLGTGPGLGAELGAELGTLVALFALSELVRAGAVLWLIREVLRRTGPIVPAVAELRAALPFFAIGVTGLLSSRIDSYLVAGFLAAQSLAMYQALILGFGFLQRAVALLPVIYAVPLLRLPQAGIRRLMWRNLALGAVGVALAVPSVPLAVRLLFGFDIPFGLSALAGLACLPVFAVAPAMQAMLRRGAERQLVGISLTGAVLGGALGAVLVPRFGLLGAQAAMLCSNLAEFALALSWLLRQGRGR